MHCESLTARRHGSSDVPNVFSTSGMHYSNIIMILLSDPSLAFLLSAESEKRPEESPIRRKSRGFDTFETMG
jgi:hypothetical protein